MYLADPEDLIKRLLETEQGKKDELLTHSEMLDHMAELMAQMWISTTRKVEFLGLVKRRFNSELFNFIKVNMNGTITW